MKSSLGNWLSAGLGQFWKHVGHSVSFLSFYETGSLCSSGYPEICSVDQPGLNLTERL